MKKILLPTDFSENSLNAINYALQLFNHLECTFYILNVQKESDFILDDLMIASTTTSLHSAIAQDNKKKLRELVTTLEKEHHLENFTFKKLFDFDSLTAAINQVISSEQMDLIIMGSNGATGAKEVIFGSNTLKVIRGVKCPILIIPENYQFQPIASIVFSTERCKDINKNKITPLLELLQMHRSSLNVLELEPSHPRDKESTQNCIEYLFREVPFNKYTIREVPSAMAINSAVQLLNFDLHALFVKQESFIDRLLFGSKDVSISYKTMIPLLILHP